VLLDSFGSDDFGSFGVAEGSDSSSILAVRGEEESFGVVFNASSLALYSISTFGCGGRWAKGSGGACGRALISPFSSKVK
jgi:hypothetical protein